MELKLDTTAKVVSLTIGLTTVVTSIVYLIIWLVQLNLGFVANTTMLKEFNTQMKAQDKAHVGITQTLERTNWILVGLEKRMVKVEEYVEYDDAEIERIDRKADGIERDFKNHLNNHDWGFE